MSRNGKILLAILGFIVLVLGGAFVYIYSTAGVDSPLSVVMSSSMQHEKNTSHLGVIDTGDVMVIKNPDKMDIYSYVEGTYTGFKSFGDYGSVIIYHRGDDVNPVIHRAIVWINYNGNGTWSIPTLKDYNGLWSCTSGTNYNQLSGTLTFTEITQSQKTVSINLDSFAEKDRVSGYLTMGDNPETNRYFDQATGIISHPIQKEQIKAVAAYEIPWMGIVKVYMTENKKSNLSFVKNSIYSIAMLFILIFAVIYCCDFYHSYKTIKKKRNEILKILED